MQAMIRRSTCVLAIAILASQSAFALSAQDKPSKPHKPPATPSVFAPREFAVGVLRITYSSGAVPLTQQTVQALLVSTPVMMGALQQVQGADATQEPYVHARFEVNTDVPPRPAGDSASSEGLLVGSVWLETDATDFYAKLPQLLTAMVKRLEAALKTAYEQDGLRLEKQVKDAEAAFAAAERRYAEIQTLQQKLIQESGRAELSPAAVRNWLTGLQNQQQALQMDLAAGSSQQQALTEQIARIAAQVAGASQTDPVVTELEKVVVIREAELARVREMIKAGKAAESEINQWQERMALAKAEVARAKAAAAQGVGGDLLGKLNADLVQLAVSTVETGAKLKFVEEQIRHIGDRKLLELADRYEREVRMQLEVAADGLKEAAKTLRDREQRQRALRPPEVSLIGG